MIFVFQRGESDEVVAKEYQKFVDSHSRSEGGHDDEIFDAGQRDSYSDAARAGLRFISRWRDRIIPYILSTLN